MLKGVFRDMLYISYICTFDKTKVLKNIFHYVLVSSKINYCKNDIFLVKAMQTLKNLKIQNQKLV